MKQLRNSSLKLSSSPVVIVGKAYKNGISDALRKFNVVNVCKSIHDNQAFKAASVMDANTIVVLATTPDDPASDSVSFDIIHRLRDMGVKATIISEGVKLESKDRLLSAGANHVVRPVRTYPEMLVRTVLSPGSEQIINDLFDSFGEECVRYNLDIKDQWANVVVKMVQHDVGTPIAYLDKNQQVISNAKPYDVIEASAVFVIVREGNLKSHTELNNVLVDNIAEY